jgi:hypothetical protein
LISPVQLNSHGKITSSPPPGLAVPTKGWNIQESGFGSSFLTAMRATYPWIK